MGIRGFGKKNCKLFLLRSTVENVNEAIELFNIAQLLDTEVRLRKWDEDTYNGYKAKSPLVMKICAKFFSKTMMIAL